MKSHFAPNSPEQLFHVLRKKHTNALDQLLSRHGLDDIGQPIILTILSQQKGGTIASQNELAKHLRVSPATITVSLKSMERNGYITKLSNVEDMRCKPICITEKGMEAAKRLDNVFESLAHGMYRGFSPEEQEQVAGFYSRMIANLEAIATSEV